MGKAHMWADLLPMLSARGRLVPLPSTWNYPWERSCQTDFSPFFCRSKNTIHEIKTNHLFSLWIYVLLTYLTVMSSWFSLSKTRESKAETDMLWGVEIKNVEKKEYYFPPQLKLLFLNLVTPATLSRTKKAVNRIIKINWE